MPIDQLRALVMFSVALEDESGAPGAPSGEGSELDAPPMTHRPELAQGSTLEPLIAAPRRE